MFDLTHILDWHEYTKLLIGLIAVVNPLGGIPLSLAITSNQPADIRRRVVLVSVLVAVAVMIIFTFIGQDVLDIFGISLPAFRISGGILIAYFALSQLEIITPRAQDLSAAESRLAAIVPMGIPKLAGPGAMSTLVIFSTYDDDPAHILMMLVVILSVGLLTYTILRLADTVNRVMGTTGISIFNRVMGLLLLAIAIEFIVDGIAGHFLLEVVH